MVSSDPRAAFCNLYFIRSALTDYVIYTLYIYYTSAGECTVVPGHM